MEDSVPAQISTVSSDIRATDEDVSLVSDTTSGALVTSGCSDDEIVIQVQRGANASTAAVTGPWHPVYLLGRLSLGFVF